MHNCHKDLFCWFELQLRLVNEELATLQLTKCAFRISTDLCPLKETHQD